MTTYLATTFTPSMLAPRTRALVREIECEEAKGLARGAVSAVGHEVTAHILTQKLGYPVQFSRVSLTLQPGDAVVCVIPQFRAEVAREFTREEIERAPFRCFHVEVSG